MELVAKTAKISTPSDAFVWATSFSENGLFVLLEARGNEVNPAAVVGKEVLDLLITN